MTIGDWRIDVDGEILETLLKIFLTLAKRFTLLVRSLVLFVNRFYVRDGLNYFIIHNFSYCP